MVENEYYFLYNNDLNFRDNLDLFFRCNSSILKIRREFYNILKYNGRTRELFQLWEELTDAHQDELNELSEQLNIWTNEIL